VSINARTEDDVDEQLIIGKVAKASGANYSYHKEAKQPMPAAEPVVCPSYYLFHFSDLFVYQFISRITQKRRVAFHAILVMCRLWTSEYYGSDHSCILDILSYFEMHR